MIRQAQGPGLGKVFVYDANDQRIGVLDYKSAATVQELWSLRGANRQVLRDFAYSGSWTWKEDYIRRGDSLLATDSGGGTIKHYALDHLGTPRLITDGNGKKLVYRAYFPFGEEISPVTNLASQPERMQFTGHERDDNDRAPGSQIGDLDYMHARYYGPMTGRFLSVDPGRDVDPRVPQSWNHYAYVRNSPVGTIDPTGLASQGGQAAQADLWHREEQARAEWQKAEQERAETCAAAEEHVDYRDLTNKIGPLSMWVWVELGPIGKVAKTTAITIATPFAAAGGLVGDVTTLPLRPIPQVNQKLNDRFGNNVLGMTTMALGAMEKTLAHVWGGPHDGWVACIRATHRAKDAQQAWSDQTVKFDIMQAWSLSR
jgi:RHS repeat-associated protein